MKRAILIPEGGPDSVIATQAITEGVFYNLYFSGNRFLKMPGANPETEFLLWYQKAGRSRIDRSAHTAADRASIAS